MSMISVTVTREELNSFPKKLSKDNLNSLRTYLLQMVYSGKGDTAWKILNEFSKTHQINKNELKNEVMAQVKLSDFNKDIYTLNGWKYTEQDFIYECPY